jgi:sulfonate transport system permease protein
VIGAWEVAVRSGLFPPSQSAAPSAIFATLGALLASGVLVQQAAISVTRLVIGIGIGSLLGVASGIVVAISKRLTRALSPTLHWLAGVPIVLWIPFCVMVLGTGEAYKIGIAAVAAFFLLYTAAFHAARSTERTFTELADIYEKSTLDRIRHIILPSSTDGILSAVRGALVFGWVVLFFVEYASSRSGREGLGWFVADARSVGKVEEEFAGLLLLAAVAYGMDRLVMMFQRRRLAWRNAHITASVDFA